MLTSLVTCLVHLHQLFKVERKREREAEGQGQGERGCVYCYRKDEKVADEQLTMPRLLLLLLVFVVASSAYQSSRSSLSSSRPDGPEGGG